MVPNNTKITKLAAAAVLLIFVCIFTVCSRSGAQSAAPRQVQGEPRENWAHEPIQPIPLEVDLNPAKVSLGEKLFNDTRLSHDNTISCASCHELVHGGADHSDRSRGIGGRIGAVNSPTVYNAAYNFKQFWDGRAETLEAQIDGPSKASDEMGSSWEEITSKLRGSPEYVSEFASVYPEGIEALSIKDAIAAFERSLITPNARFDKFLRGDQDALTTEEKEGYKTFKSVGCISCHQGVNAGGNLFQEFGIMGAYFTDRGNVTKADLGRFNITHNEADKHVFKVPGLRNVSQTFPYFHDGSVTTLEEAVAVMSKYQLGRELSPREIGSIVLFLKTLDGDYKRYTP